MLFIIIIGLMLSCFSGIFLLEGFALFKDKPRTFLNVAIGCFSTALGLLMLYLTVCFIYFTCFRSTSVGQTLLITLGF